MHGVLKWMGLVLLVLWVPADIFGGEAINLKTSRHWQMGGRVQLQHLYNPNIAADESKTTQGFRMRRGRFWVKAKLTDWIHARIQLSIRDARVRILDLYTTFRLFDSYYLKIGQAKVPVWREELRSSGKLLLVERSAVAQFLLDYQLSGWQIGVEFGKTFTNGATLALSYTNGSGMNVREDAGRSKSDFVNNGKLYVARITLPVGNILSLGVSGVYNQVGYYVKNIQDNRGAIVAIIPDFNLRLGSGVELEGGLVSGSVSKAFTGATNDERFFLADVSGRWTKTLGQPNPALAGMDAVEIAAGVTYMNPNPSSGFLKKMVFRTGPAVYFGKNARLQLNIEYEQPDDDSLDATMLLRTQVTVNF